MAQPPMSCRNASPRLHTSGLYLEKTGYENRYGALSRCFLPFQSTTTPGTHVKTLAGAKISFRMRSKENNEYTPCLRR
jgi:hypothetical protein